jgi:hypothetical protein
MVAELSPAGKVGLQIISRDAWVPEGLPARLRQWSPRSELGRIVRECLRHLPAELAAELIERISASVVIESALALVVFRPLTERGIAGPCRVEDHGVVSRRVVTNNGVGYIVDAFQNLVELENMKYHGLGTGTTAEAAGDSALVTELTTEYNPNSTRATGTTTETSSNIFQTVGTNTLDSGTPAVTEHGVFSASSAGVLLDRSVFSAINLVGANGDSVQSTYSLTCSAGG